MTLYFATEARFVKHAGNYYSLGGFAAELWKRYLEHFDDVVVIARVSGDKSLVRDESMLASHPNVRFVDLPYYVGFSGFLKNMTRIRRIISDNLVPDACYICRLPGQIGGMVSEMLRHKGLRYACEVVGNPWDVYAKGSVSHPLRPLIRIVSTLSLKRQVKGAAACLYVTGETLQKMYPADSEAFSIGVSDVNIPDELYAKSPKVLHSKKEYTLISVGSLDQMYKSPDVLLKSMSWLKQGGVDLRLVWLGNGRYRSDMVALAEKLGVNAEFKGAMASDQVHEELEKADIFVLASRTEGLPRAIVEAMAHGLPCIGSRVGGIPELLDDAVLVEKENIFELARVIEKFILTPEFADQQAKRNLQTSLLFRSARLKQMRDTFFEYIKRQYCF